MPGASEREPPVVSGRHLPKLPLLLLLIQAAALFTFLTARDQLRPTVTKDTRSYLELARAGSLEEILSSRRTYGYSLFLRSTGAARTGFKSTPLLHLLSYMVGVLLFWCGSWELTSSPWLALAAVSPLLHAHALELLPLLESDLLGLALALCALSLLLLLVKHPASRTLWAALTATTFLAYQVRPAYVVLVPVLPLAGFALWLALDRGRVIGPLRRTAALLLSTLLPWLLFCSLRLVVVGHFGLVSFGGFQAVATAATFLDHRLVRRLPPAERELARRILAHRRDLGYEPFTGQKNGREWYDQYNDNMWRIAFNAAIMMRRDLLRERQQGGPGRQRLFSAVFRGRPPIVDINQQFVDLSWAVFRRRPGLYFRWIRNGFLDGLSRALRYPWVLWPGLALLLSLPLAAFHRGRGAGRSPEPGRTRGILGLALLAVSFFLGYLAMISVVTIPYDRYLVCTILLLPGAIAATLVHLWSGVFRSLGASPAPVA